MTNPVTQLTRAFLIADGYDPDYELHVGSEQGIARKYRTLAEVAVKTLDGEWKERAEAYREVLRSVTVHDFCAPCNRDVREVLARFEGTE